MEIGVLTGLLRGRPSDLYNAFRKEQNSRFDPLDFLNYDTRTHKVVRDRIYRPDRIVHTPVPNAFLENGKQVTEYKLVPVTRVAVAFQEEIVDSTVSFSVGGKINIVSKPKTEKGKKLHDAVVDMWNYNKMQYKIKNIARRMFSETESAFIMFTSTDSDKTELRTSHKIISPSTGHTLYPIFNAAGKMIAFGYDYISSDNKISFDVYTDTFLYKFAYADWNELTIIKTVPIPFKKIPVAYFNQEESEWRKVQSLIDRFETSFSNLCDTNDYNGSPIMFGEGTITGFADKGETGKLIMGENGAKLSYLTWDKAPESIKLELETLKEMIYNKTRSVDLSPQAIKGMGTAPSGVAFDRMLISPHMKAQDKQDGSLGEGIQRIINLFKSAVINWVDETLVTEKSLYIEPEFSLFRIDDLQDRIQTMAIARPGKILVSAEASTKYINATSNHDDELTAIQKEDTLDSVFNQPEV